MIEVKNLTKSFGDKTVLRGINARFETGKTNLIIGQSGSGKTVLMKNLVGLLHPTSGEVLYDGRDFVGMTKRDIRESVNAQMLLIFLLPLAAAALHLAFAQPMVWQIMQLFGIQNLTLFLGVTGAALLLFALLYCAMYRLTSNAYFRIVSTGGAAA